MRIHDPCRRITHQLGLFDYQFEPRFQQITSFNSDSYSKNSVATLMSELIRHLAAKAHEHQLVPFIGAGCSLGHVQVDWDGITQVMASCLTPQPSGTNAQIAEAYVRSFGERALAELLAQHLLLKEFQDERGTIPLEILALELRALYTTNQDNVFELAAERYGRPIVVVSTLEDLRKVRSGDRILYKFHGAIEHPESLVFTDSQYRIRMNSTDHFMDIRLRSDLLTKSLLFVGYSFRDPNVKVLLQELQTRFPKSLPGSYLIAHQWSQDLHELCANFGVECVDPAANIGAPSTDATENLGEFLGTLCEETLALYTSAELDNLLTPKRPVPARVAIRRQIETIATLASTGAAGALTAFRGTCDRTIIPLAFQATVSGALVEIIQRSAPEQDGEIKGALFNLQIRVTEILKPAAAYLAFANRIPAQALSVHVPPGNVLPSSLLPVAAAIAVQLLLIWKEPISDNFYSRSSQWFDQHWVNLTDELKGFVRPWIAKAWASRHTIYENPIARAERLGALNKQPLFLAKTYNEINHDLIESLQKLFPTPFE